MGEPRAQSSSTVSVWSTGWAVQEESRGHHLPAAPLRSRKGGRFQPGAAPAQSTPRSPFIPLRSATLSPLRVGAISGLPRWHDSGLPPPTDHMRLPGRAHHQPGRLGQARGGRRGWRVKARPGSEGSRAADGEGHSADGR